MSFIYLASPYADPDVCVSQDRYEAALRHTAWALEGWQTTYSPITHGHVLSRNMESRYPDDYQFWLHHDINILERAMELHVLMLDGWQHSKGCIMEVEYALSELNIPVKGVMYQCTPSGLVFVNPGDPQPVSVPDADPPIIKPAVEKHLYLVS